MKLTYRKSSALAVTAVALFAITACSQPAAPTPSESSSTDDDWAAVESAAASEGAVQVYSTLVPAQFDSLLAAFNEQYPGIAVTLTRGTNIELGSRAEAEAASGSDGGDVMILASSQWHSANVELNADISDLPAAAEWPAEAWSTPDIVPTVSYLPTAMITWNTEIFPDGFENWDDVLASDVSGRLGLFEGFDLNVASYYTFLDGVLGGDALAEFEQQQPRFYPSTIPMTQAIASGEIGVSVWNVTPTIFELQKQGAPIDYVIPSESYAANFDGSVLDNSKRPNAARVFLNFTLSPEGQEALNGNGFAVSPLPDVPGTVPGDGMRILSDPPVLTQQEVDAFNARFKEVFGR